jgi:flagellar hook-basal body complex protein FliE
MTKSGINPVLKSFYLKQYENITRPEAGGGFKQTLSSVMDRFDEIQTAAADQSGSLIAGGQVDSHDVMIAAQEASLAFELMLEVRNKLVEAYQELMRMQF